MARKTASIQVIFDMEELKLRRTDINVKAFRPKLRLIGRTMVKQARHKVSKVGVSKPGEYPGRQTGKLRKAIKYRLFKSGFGLVLMQGMPDGAEEFYPSFLRYGAKRKRGGVLKARKNYIEDTGRMNRDYAFQVVREAIDESLKGIFEK